MSLLLLAIRDWGAPLSPAGEGKQSNKGKTEGWEFSQTCWEGEAWALEFGGQWGPGELEGEAPALENGGGAHYCPWAGFSLGRKQGWVGQRWEVGWSGDMLVCDGLHLGTRQETKKCSEQEQGLRRGPRFLLRCQLSEGLKSAPDSLRNESLKGVYWCV